MRVEVNWSNGNFTAFPNVKDDNSFIEEKDYFKFKFGKTDTHVAIIYKDKINFIELSKEEE